MERCGSVVAAPVSDVVAFAQQAWCGAVGTLAVLVAAVMAARMSRVRTRSARPTSDISDCGSKMTRWIWLSQAMWSSRARGLLPARSGPTGGRALETPPADACVHSQNPWKAFGCVLRSKAAAGHRHAPVSVGARCGSDDFGGDRGRSACHCEQGRHAFGWRSTGREGASPETAAAHGGRHSTDRYRAFPLPRVPGCPAAATSHALGPASAVAPTLRTREPSSLRIQVRPRPALTAALRDGVVEPGQRAAQVAGVCRPPPADALLEPLDRREVAALTVAPAARCDLVLAP